MSPQPSCLLIDEYCVCNWWKSCNCCVLLCLCKTWYFWGLNTWIHRNPTGDPCRSDLVCSFRFQSVVSLCSHLNFQSRLHPTGVLVTFKCLFYDDISLLYVSFFLQMIKLLKTHPTRCYCNYPTREVNTFLYNVQHCMAALYRGEGLTVKQRLQLCRFSRLLVHMVVFTLLLTCSSFIPHWL